MPRPPKVLHLDDLEALPGPGTLTWLPVRYSLGVRAFGCNAYSAHEAGQDVVEPHTEDPKLAHEELYFVARGSATFTIDEQAYPAPAGTYVFVPDPSSHRYAVADEPGTIVLSFGGPPSFEPSAWEWAFRASALRESDPAAARRILEEGLATHPESPTLRYELAVVAALGGRTEEALDQLAKAIEQHPEISEWARDDADFAALRNHERFQALVGT
jgi:tetratricopeptide (TPR) repeat protein